MDASLAKIESSEEQIWIEETFMDDYDKGDYDSIWIGLMRFKAKDHDSSSFRWLSGEVVNFTNWHPVEPNNIGGMQFCVALWGRKDTHEGTWFDAKCDKKYRALCQRPFDGLPRFSSEKPKAKVFNYAIREEYRLLDDANQEMERISIRIWAMSALNMILIVILVGMIILGDFSHSPLGCLFFWKKRTSTTDGNGQNGGIVNHNYTDTT